MNSKGWLGYVVALVLVLPSAARADPLGGLRLNLINRLLFGRIVDYSHHCGADRRIWSPTLQEHRDLFVYLPPGYDPSQCYPGMLWLHGFMQDEETFLDFFVRPLDEAIAEGRLPPIIVAAPDGSLGGRASLFEGNSFFLNSDAGNFEDYVIQDVWGFLVTHYPIRPEPEAHVLIGLSMGGFAAFNQSMKHPDLFKVAVGIYPPLNLRWVNCHGRYMGNFDPCCWGWRTSVDRGREPIGRFFGGLVTIRMRAMVDPLFERGPHTVARLSWENPTEMIGRLGLTGRDRELYVAYGGRDEFNIDAQVESFLYVARQHGLCVDVGYYPHGRHHVLTARRALPDVFRWLTPRLAPYSPPTIHCPRCGAGR